LTDETLKVVLARLEERIIASDKALSVATNELHRTVESLTSEQDRRWESLDQRLKVLENQSANFAGKTWIGGAVVLILAAIIASVIPLVMK